MLTQDQIDQFHRDGILLVENVADANTLAAMRSQRVAADLAYGPQARHRLDVYAPASAAPSGGHPVVVFFYGGSWNRGERADYRFVGEALAARGVLTPRDLNQPAAAGARPGWRC